MAKLGSFEKLVFANMNWNLPKKSCIENIMKLVKDREFSDLCFDFSKKNDLMEIVTYLSSEVASNCT